jgi:hypothetical protein
VSRPRSPYAAQGRIGAVPGDPKHRPSEPSDLLGERFGLSSEGGVRFEQLERPRSLTLLMQLELVVSLLCLLRREFVTVGLARLGEQDQRRA